MKDIIIEGSHGKNFIPNVKFIAETGVCELGGESYLEDTVTFYAKLLDWLTEFKETKRPILFDFKLSYFNTSTSKSILDILTLLKKHENEGGQVTVNWYYDDEEEEDVEAELEDVEDLIIETGLKINLIPLEASDDDDDDDDFDFS